MSTASKKVAIVAGLVLVAGLALVAWSYRAPVRIAPDAAPAVAVNSPDASAPAESETDSETGEMVKTKTELKAAYAERRAELPAEVAKPIDQDIGVIEGAAADLLVAIAHEPEDPDLKRMLVATYRNELRLLKKALHLSGEEKDSDDPSAASTPPAPPPPAAEPKRIVQ